MEIYGIFDYGEVEEIALKFSKENKIVESKEWANLIVENGLDGGNTSQLRKYKKHTITTKLKISNTLNEIQENGKSIAQNANQNKLSTIYSENYDRSNYGKASNETKKKKY